MSLRRRITRLVGRRRSRSDTPETGGDAPEIGGDTPDIGSLDRRSYDTAWRRFDRRAVAPALVGATMMIPMGAEAAPARASRERGSDEPERERRGGESALRGARMYVKPNSPAMRQAQDWRSSRRQDAALLEYIASQPTGSWLGDWNNDVARDADRILDDATRRGQVPLIVAYNIPNRDCGSHSAGGAGSVETYREWVRELARGIGDREAIVILEPDAMALVSCLTHEGRSERFSLIREAVSVLKSRTKAYVYIDAGHAQWVDAEEMAQRLHLAGIDNADGFSLNVSNFVSTERNLAYGEQVSRRLSGAHFVIDTSRNGGNVASGEWCNPSGAALGGAPTTETGHPLADAFLWVKPPGESDGACNGGPAAGRWWADYALEMARRSSVA